MDTFLPYENKISEFLVASGMSIICFLVFRSITQKPLQFFLDNKHKFKDHDETAGSNKEKVLDINHWNAVKVRCMFVRSEIVTL